MLPALMLLALCLPGWADVTESAKLLPDDTMVMVSVESVKGLQTAMEKTSMYGLYKDPAMQPFVTESEKKIRELIDTTIKDFWQKMKIENPPEQIPIPEGRLVLAISLFKPPVAADANAEESGGGPGVRFTVLADMGAQVEQAKKMIASLTASATNAGSKVAKKDVGGLELNVIAPAEESSNDPTVYYGLKDNWLVLVGDTTKELTFAESIVKRMGRSLPGSLADKAGLKSAAKTLGESQLFVFVNADAIKSFAGSMAPDKAQVDRIVQALGFQNVTGLSMATQIGGQKNQEGVSRMLIGVNGPKTGIPAMLGDGSGPMKLNARLLPRDAVGFLCANYEPAKIFDAINKIAQSIAFVDLNMLVQSPMAATAGEGGQPAVQFRDDVLAQMGAPVLFTWQMEKPYSFTSMTRFLVALSAKDAARLDGAMGRIHQAFLGAMPDSKRELLNHTLYLLPSGNPGMQSQNDNDAGNSQVAAAAAKNNAMAFSVAGDALVFGQVDEVEQAIRNQQTEPQDSLLTDPMFRYAKDSLPSQACLFLYQNNRLNTETTWAALKQLAKDMAKQGENASQEDQQSWNPMMMAIQKIKPYVDLNKLPEFKAVEKYWGASVGYMQNRPEGLYWETISLKPPQQ